MIVFNSCKEAIANSLENKKFSLAHLYTDEKPDKMHIHDTYELYYSISGGKQFLIANKLYSIAPGDLFFINQYEVHHLIQADKENYERILFSIHPQYLKSLSSCETNLDTPFSDMDSVRCHKLSLDSDEQKRFMLYIHRLAEVNGYGADLKQQAVFTELFLFLTETYIKYHKKEKVSLGRVYDSRVDAILAYIHEHISEELTIELLSKEFFVSSSYLCRFFHNSTGMTIKKYILSKRIALAKYYLTDGFSVQDTLVHCGFADYSNFLKAFTKSVGMSPKKYAQIYRRL